LVTVQVSHTQFGGEVDRDIGYLNTINEFLKLSNCPIIVQFPSSYFTAQLIKVIEYSYNQIFMFVAQHSIREAV